ncbi:methyl farnesoate epoxidase-like isoform X2 [Zootermopsis nevadensis]|nr:methyl farnesoate epoxidase-like isoform X2 [Zootermopsis nevadensis]
MDIIIALAVIIVIFVYLWTNTTPKNFPPGPPCLPVLGSIPFLPRKYLHCVMAGSWMDKYGPVVGLMFGTKKALGVSGAKAVLEVLRRDEFQGRVDNSRTRDISFNKRLGIIFTDGPYWLQMKRFSLRHLKDFGFGKADMGGLIMQEVEDLVIEMRSKDTVQMYGLFKISALNVISGVMSGMRYARDDEELQALVNNLDELVRRSFRSGKISNIFPILKRLFPRITGSNEIMYYIKNAYNFIQRKITEHKQVLNENNPRDFIDAYLIEMQKGNSNGNAIFTEEGLIVTCHDFFVAGGDTTNNTLVFCLLYMILHPQVQNAVQEELDSVVGQDRRPSVEDRQRLHYVNAVISEVMRINPVVPLTVPHRVTKDTNLHGYTIPKDTMVLINLWSVHHDRGHWGDPEVFRPERFLDENRNFVKDEWIISFGAGKRMCLGEAMARNTIFLFFTSLLQEFLFSLPEDDPPPQTLPLPGMTMAPQPFRVKITRRI